MRGVSERQILFIVLTILLECTTRLTVPFDAKRLCVVILIFTALLLDILFHTSSARSQTDY